MLDRINLRRHLSFLTSGHSDAQGKSVSVPGRQKLQMTPGLAARLWHRMFYDNIGRQRVKTMRDCFTAIC